MFTVPNMHYVSALPTTEQLAIAIRPVVRLLGFLLQAYDDNQKQMTLDSFLSFNQRFAKIKSRRLQKAVAGITGQRALLHILPHVHDCLSGSLCG